MSERRHVPLLGAILALALVVAGCAAGGSSPGPAGPRADAKAQLFVFSDSSPHVSVIDAETHRVTATTDIPDFTGWAWNDDNNYFDGTNLWLGLHSPETNAVEVISLDLNTLRVGHRIDLGEDKFTLYVGKVSKAGVLHVGKMAAGQIVAIDTKAGQLLKTYDVPVNGGVVCDIDVAAGPDGVERVYYPSWKGDTVVAVHPQTGEVLKSASTPKGTGPWMNSYGPDKRLWVQEGDANSNAVLDPVTLEVVKRFPTGKGPTGVSFSPDGKLAYITYFSDTIVTVVDTTTLDKVQDVQVGTNSWQVAVDPNGRLVFAIVSKEGSVAVIDTATWKVTTRIPLGTNPSGIFLRTTS